jgi:hypothetical protein
MFRTTLPLIAAVAFAASVAIAPVASAQSGSGPAPVPAQEISDNELQAYAVARLEVNEIVENVRPQLEAAASIEERSQVEQQAYQQMATAIQGSGLTVERYNQIGATVQVDPEVADDVRSYMIEQQ